MQLGAQTFGGTVSKPVFSGDDTRLAFLIADTGIHELHAADVATGNTVQLVRDQKHNRGIVGRPVTTSSDDAVSFLKSWSHPNFNLHAAAFSSVPLGEMSKATSTPMATTGTSSSRCR